MMSRPYDTISILWYGMKIKLVRYVSMGLNVLQWSMNNRLYHLICEFFGWSHDMTDHMTWLITWHYLSFETIVLITWHYWSHNRANHMTGLFHMTLLVTWDGWSHDTVYHMTGLITWHYWSHENGDHMTLFITWHYWSHDRYGGLHYHYNYFFNHGRSMNYGGIGMAIGHEQTHGFDDQGLLCNIIYTCIYTGRFIIHASIICTWFPQYEHFKGKLHS